MMSSATLLLLLSVCAGAAVDQRCDATEKSVEAAVEPPPHLRHDLAELEAHRARLGAARHAQLRDALLGQLDLLQRQVAAAFACADFADLPHANLSVTQTVRLDAAEAARLRRGLRFAPLRWDAWEARLAPDALRLVFRRRAKAGADRVRQTYTRLARLPDGLTVRRMEQRELRLQDELRYVVLLTFQADIPV